MDPHSPQLKGALFGFRRASVRQLLAGRETMFRFAQERTQAAEAKVQELQAELETARAELEAQVVSADTREAEIRAELQHASETLQVEQERAASMDAELGRLRGELADAHGVAKEHADAKREVATLRTELAAARSALVSREEQVGTGEARIASLRAELDGVRAQLAGHRAAPAAAPIPEAEDLSQMLDAAERGVTGIMERARHAYEDQLERAEAVREGIQADIERFGDWQEHVAPLIRSVQDGIETARGRILRIPDQIRQAVDSMTEAMSAVSDSLDRLASLPGPLPSDRSPGGDQHQRTSSETVIRLHGEDPGPHRPPASVRREERIEPGASIQWPRGEADAEDGTDEISHRGPSNLGH
jgi:DNA repair exonuclease SbcCD ATPase subunit